MTRDWPLYLSVPPTTSEVHWEAVRSGEVGVITTPRVGNIHYAEWPVWAADNGCFSEGEAFELDVYLEWLESVSEHQARCLFATAPDVVGEWEATWERSSPVLPKLRDLGYVAALVAQDGLTDPPWDEFDCLFIGGTTEWKESIEARRVIELGLEQEKHIHVGRVNSLRRLRLFRDVDTVDGTFIAFGPDQALPRIRKWYRAERQLEMFKPAESEISICKKGEHVRDPSEDS